MINLMILETELASLKKEQNKARLAISDLQQRTIQLRETALRIDGAIAVIEKIMADYQPGTNAELARVEIETK